MAPLVVAILSLVLVGNAAAITPVETGRFGSLGTGSGQLTEPGGVAVDQQSGDLFVADTLNNRIDRFDAEGNLVLAWGWGVRDGNEELEVCTTGCQAGIKGEGQGQLDEPSGVAVDPVSGDVYAVNYRDARVQKFEPSGTFVLEFGGYLSGGGGHFTYPLTFGNDIAVDSTGHVYVSDGYAVWPRIAVFDGNGVFERSITSESGRGELYSASSLALDSAGNLYVVDQFNDVIDVFAPGGEFLRREAATTRAEGISIDPADDHAFVLGARPDGNEYNVYEYDAAGDLVEKTQLALAPSVEGYPSYGIAFSGAASASFPGRLPGAIYVADFNGNTVSILTAAQPTVPTVERVFAASVGSDAAGLDGTVNPNGSETRYLFEYGPTAAYGSASPARPGFDLGSGIVAIESGTQLTGLEPDTVYHYRLVATNGIGSTFGSDHTFTTLAAGGLLGLPDDRSYELVSPVDKNLDDVNEAMGLSSDDGDKVAFSSYNGLPQSQSGALIGSYVASRGEDGWQTTAASAPDTNQGATLLVGNPFLYSRDLGQVVVRSHNDLTGDAPSNASGNLYLRTIATSSYQLMTPESPVPDERGSTYTMLGASADFRHIVFEFNGRLTADAPEAPPYVTQIYEWDEGRLKLGSVLPGGVPAPEGGEGVATYQVPKTGAVSEDGSRFFFVSPSGFSSQAQLYMRADGTRTVEVSKSQRAEPDPVGSRSVKFQGAATDGSSVFFTSDSELTEDADTGERDAGANLYRYDTASGTLTDLTVDADASAAAGADVHGVLIAADGTTAYFGATGVLAPGATAEASNLYRWTAARGVEFVAPIDPRDPFMTGGETLDATAQTTADGSVMVFTSAGSGEVNSTGNPVPEIYRVAGGGAACISCTGRGVAVRGATVTAPAYPGGGTNSLSSDGSRIFFETKDALLPGDTDGKGDVYEWEGGQLHLISGGVGAYDSVLIDASRSGDDVFFTTRDRLTPSDVDDNIDVYDARVDGGFPLAATAPPCSGEGCRPTVAPPETTLGGNAAVGPGNFKPKPKKKKHHPKKHHHSKKHRRGKHR